MILSRLRYRPVTVPLPWRYRPVTVPLPSRYRYNVTVTDRRPPLHTVTDRYGPFPIVTERHMRYRALQSVTERYIFYLIKNF